MIEVNNLSKHYAAIRAVDGISFSIPQGTCFGLLGPNGAGKTTTIEMLEGIKAPTGGEILYKHQPLGDRFRREAGIMFQHTALQEFIRVREALNLFKRLYDKTRPLDDLIEICALRDFLDQDTRTLSGGQKQRLMLAIALVNDPQIIFLDEPTTGLDPQSRRNLWQQVRQIKAENKTLVLTTHYMEEAYELCDEIIIIDHGRIIAQGEPKQLLAMHFDNSVITLPAESLPDDFAPDDGAMLTRKNGRAEIFTQDLDRSMRHMLAADIPFHQMEVRLPTLEDLFIKLTGHQLRA